MCDGQSVADSDSEAAKGIRTVIAARIAEGAGDDEIRDELAAATASEILLTPAAPGWPAWCGPCRSWPWWWRWRPGPHLPPLAARPAASGADRHADPADDPAAAGRARGAWRREAGRTDGPTAGGLDPGRPGRAGGGAATSCCGSLDDLEAASTRPATSTTPTTRP